MFVREVLAVVYSSDTLLCPGSRLASTAVLQKLVTITDLEFESSYFMSRVSIN